MSTQIRPDLGSLSSISSKRIRERRNRRRKVLLEQRRERSEHDSDNANPNDDESNDIVLVGGDEFLLELVGGVGILLELVLGSALPGCVLAIDLVLEQEGVDIVICERGTNMSAYASPCSIAQPSAAAGQPDSGIDPCHTTLALLALCVESVAVERSKDGLVGGGTRPRHERNIFCVATLGGCPLLAAPSCALERLDGRKAATL